MGAAYERERTRLARILHDEIGQLLTAAGFQLDALRLDFGEQAPGLAARTREIQSLLGTAMAHVREISTDLHPDMVRRIGLAAALERLAERARRNGLAAEVDFQAGERVPAEPAAELFKIAADTLAQAEYSGAATIRFKVTAGDGAYVLEVLYDVASPEKLEKRPAKPVRVSVSTDPAGGTAVRALYSHAIRGSAG